MKRIFVALVCALLLVACSQDDYTNVIPANSKAVVYFDLKSIAVKSGIGELNYQNELLGKLNSKDSKNDKKLSKYIEDPTEIGLDFGKRIYGFYILLSGPALSASCVLNNIMRYEGKASLAMVGLVSGGVLNMIGDPVFMFGLKMGIHGAGLSTALSQYISFGILLYMFISKKTMTSISLKKAKGFGEELTRIMQNGTPSLIRQMLNSLSTMSLNIIAKPYGDAAIAGMTIVGRIVMFFASTMVGIGQAYQPVAAFNYGAKKYKRIREGFLVTWVLGETVLGIFAIIAFINPEPLILLFRNDSRVLAIGKNALRFHCIALIASPLSVVSNMMFQSIGESAIASFLAALRSGIYYIPILFILSRLLGILGIQSAQMVADILTTLTCIPFLMKFFRELPKKNMHVKMDDDYKHSS